MKAPTPEAFRLFHFGAQELARVEANGIAVDTARLDAASARVAAEVKELEARLLGDRTWRRWKRAFGDKATLTSDVQLGHVLFKLLKVPYPWEGDEDGRTKTGRYFTDAETLDRVDLPFVKDHQRMKRLLKLESTYLSGIRREVVDGFIHCVFNLHLVDTYRSCVAKGTIIEVVRDVSKAPKGVPIESVRPGDFVYCYNDKLELVIRKVLWAGKTGHRKVVRLHWVARGKKGYLDVTPEHKIRLCDGRYVMAKDLDGADFRKSKKAWRSPRIRTLALGRRGATLFTTWQGTLLDHRLVYEQLVGDLPADKVVHHKDNNHLNNNPSNLQRMTLAAHSSHHAPDNLTDDGRRKGVKKRQENHKLYGDRWSKGAECWNWIGLGRFEFLRMLARAQGSPTKMPYDYPVIIRKAKEFGVNLAAVRDRYDRDGAYISRGGIKSVYAGRATEIVYQYGINYAKARRMLSARGFECAPPANNRNPYGRSGKPRNHKIVHVEYLEEAVDVYDLEVEDEHNFIANEICVHNSSSDINIQNQYSRDPEFAEVIRSCFTARHPDWCLSEIDYGALEFCIAASVWDDPAMIGYANDPAKDVHRDMAAELYLCNTAQVTKAMRSTAKNKFVFPILYGSYYISCARSLWAAAADMTGPDGKTPLRDHLKARGITRLGKLDPRSTPAPDTYEAVVKRVEEGFYARFTKFASGKKRLLESYRKTGRVDYVTGFRITSSGRRGVLSVNNLLNSKIQGPGFHCLLLSMVKLGSEMRRRKLKSLMVAEIHDCILFDGPEGELQDLLTLARRVMTEDVPAEWPWIKSKLKAEVDVTPPGGAWSEKKPWECVNGTWQPKGKK